MRIVDLSPFFQSFYRDLEDSLNNTDNLFFVDITENLNALADEYTDASQTVSVLHKTHRLIRICKAGLLDNKAFKEALEEYNFPGWDDYEPLQADIALQEDMADKLYNIKPYDKCAALRFGFQSNHIANELFDRCVQSDKPFFIDFVDPAFNRFVLNACDDVESYGQYNNKLLASATTRMSVAPNAIDPIPFKMDVDKGKIFSDQMHEAREQVSSGKCFFTLTNFPTPLDADRDQMPYDQYLDLYFEMSDQPWDHINKAHEKLIKKFNAASQIRFTNNDGTDVTMSLIDSDGTPFTFCNSLIARNVPGSEIFSAPRRDSVNGRIVAKGLFAPRHDESLMIKDLVMDFENGKLVRFSASEGAEHFQAFLDRDPNNYYIGELGIGTNPYLKTHLMNILLVEKIGGSFHVALGDCYKMTDYLGTPVHVNNGNDSRDHWDITTMLYGKEGCIELDGEIVMKDGLWLDPGLAVLNDGWNAIPMDQRPKRWQKQVAPFTGPRI